MALNNIFSCVLICVALFSYVSYASDPPPLQDFCVGILNSSFPFIVNGLLCKNENEVESEDFVFRGQLATPRDTNNFVGATVTPASVLQFPALNIQGVSLARIDFGPRGGLNPPHVHPRASELNLVLEGTILAGFVTTNQFGNRFFSSILKPGDAIIFPQGLLHFEFNIGDTPGVAFASFSSQNPGVLTLANASFGSDPRIPVDVLARAYNLDPRIVMKLEEFFTPSPIAEGAA